MAAIISIAVGAIGTAVGTAIGAAIGGTLFGISAATIGGVIGAGIAGGILAEVKGGDFGKGFLVGAVGASIGAFMKGGLGSDVGGATQAADGTTTAQMLAEQGGAEFAPDAFSGTGDLAATGASAGMGEIGGTAGGAETFALDQMDAPVGTPLDGTTSTATTPSWEGGLQDTVNSAQMDFNMADTGNMVQANGNMAAPDAPSGFNTSGTDQFATQSSAAAEAPLLSGDYSGTEVGDFKLENVGSAPEPVQMGYSEGTPSQTGSGFAGGVQKMFKTSDAWLKDTLGKNAPSTGKLLMGGGQYLMDQRNLKKQQAMATQMMSPMSFEEYSQNYTDPGAYRNASENMARGGRTGSLPLLLARMKNDARKGYAAYLPGARGKYYDAQAGVQANKNASLARLFNGMGYYGA